MPRTNIKIKPSRREYADRNYTLIYTDNPDFNLATPETAEDLAKRIEQEMIEGTYMIKLLIWVDDPENEGEKITQPFWFLPEKIRGFGDR